MADSSTPLLGDQQQRLKNSGMAEYNPSVALASPVLVTGANSGLGFETCRKLAGLTVPRIYLGCRNRARAEAAVDSLVEKTGAARNLFDIVIMDTGDLASCRAAAESIDEPLGAVVCNAGGGMGGMSHTKEGASIMFSVNVLGHAEFVQTLLRRGKLVPGGVVVFAGSEGARGVPAMKIPRPSDIQPTVASMEKVITFSKFDETFSAIAKYSYVKLVGVLYFSALARRHREQYIASVSPGNTPGTSGAKKGFGKCGACCYYYCIAPMMKCCGIAHSVSDGADNYMRALTDVEFWREFPPGSFAASVSTGTGKLINQVDIWDIFANEAFQEAAYEAVQRYLSAVEPAEAS